MTEGEQDFKLEKQGQSMQQEIKDNKDDDDVILFIEYKYCTVCHIEQVSNDSKCLILFKYSP